MHLGADLQELGADRADDALIVPERGGQLRQTLIRQLRVRGEVHKGGVVGKGGLLVVMLVVVFPGLAKSINSMQAESRLYSNTTWQDG